LNGKFSGYSSPSVSPNGRWIASQVQSENVAAYIGVVGSNGGSFNLIDLKERELLESPWWASDSELIYSATKTSNGVSHGSIESNKLTVRDRVISGGSRTTLAQFSSYSAATPSMNAASREIALASNQSAWGIFLFPLGSQPSRVTDVASEAYAPAWSPNGQELAYQMDGQIWINDLRGSRAITGSHGNAPAWSPDGRLIATTSEQGCDGVPGLPKSYGNIWVFNAETGQSKRLTSDCTAFFWRVAWMP
jgi:Tol biopolymer transport system component